MSTTTPPSADGHVSPERAFDRLVWQNPRVCNGCFEHVKDIDEYRISGGAVEHDVEDHHRTARATLEQDAGVVDDYGELEAYRPRTTCRSCARIGCWADDELESQLETIEEADDLSDIEIDLVAGAAEEEIEAERERQEFEEELVAELGEDISTSIADTDPLAESSVVDELAKTDSETSDEQSQLRETIEQTLAELRAIKATLEGGQEIEGTLDLEGWKADVRGVVREESRGAARRNRGSRG